LIGIAVAVGEPLSPALISLGAAACLAAGILHLVRRREGAGAADTGAPAGREVSTGGRDLYSAGLVLDAGTPSQSPPGVAGDGFARAIGDVIAELYALRGHLEAAGTSGPYAHGYGLPPDERRAAANALEDAGLPQVRRALDAAHNECDRINRLLPARSWSAGPVPEAVVPPVVPEVHLHEAIAKVDAAIRELEGVQS